MITRFDVRLSVSIPSNFLGPHVPYLSAGRECPQFTATFAELIQQQVKRMQLGAQDDLTNSMMQRRNAWRPRRSETICFALSMLGLSAQPLLLRRTRS
jgi:hypothetical protein